MIGMSFGARCEIRQKAEARLRFDYEIKAHTECLICGHRFNPETETGWNENPRDCSITCPGCGNQFKGRLEVRSRATEGSIRSYNGFFTYLCPSQTLYEMSKLLKKRGRLGEKFLHNKCPRIYFSMIKSFGSYKNARAKV